MTKCFGFDFDPNFYQCCLWPLFLQDFQVSWFLPYCYGTPAPEDSIVVKCKDLDDEKANQLIASVDIPYTFIKSHKIKLTNESKERIAKAEKRLTALLW